MRRATPRVAPPPASEKRGGSLENLALPTFYTIRVISEALDVSPRTVRRWIDRGELIAHKLGHSIRISDNDFRVFLARRRGV